MPTSVQKIMDKCLRYIVALRPTFTEIVKLMKEACKNEGTPEEFYADERN